MLVYDTDILIEHLGLSLTQKIDVEECSMVQVNIGTWRRINSTSWGFDPTYEGNWDNYLYDPAKVSDKELIEILGLDFDADEGLEYEHKHVVKRIPVCAGDWVRLDQNTWYFEYNPEWLS